MNTCYSLVAPDYGISIAGVYRVIEEKITAVEGSEGVSPTHRTRYGPSKRHTHSHGTATSRQTCSPEPVRADVWRQAVVGLRPHPDGAASCTEELHHDVCHDARRTGSVGARCYGGSAPLACWWHCGQLVPGRRQRLCNRLSASVLATARRNRTV